MPWASWSTTLATRLQSAGRSHGVAVPLGDDGDGAGGDLGEAGVADGDHAAGADGAPEVHCGPFGEQMFNGREWVPLLPEKRFSAEQIASRIDALAALRDTSNEPNTIAISVTPRRFVAITMAVRSGSTTADWSRYSRAWWSYQRRMNRMRRGW